MNKDTDVKSMFVSFDNERAKLDEEYKTHKTWVDEYNSRFSTQFLLEKLNNSLPEGVRGYTKMLPWLLGGGGGALLADGNLQGVLSSVLSVFGAQ